ncbi:hypothetical protein A3844_09255 [Paenibacillus helianthi]|uniref:Uncharacterized protein n=1 Tax=Paenibacillus helianthi TaxID=1349432 RepID=A0ABX3ERA8_9BACL|nr:MULTISPECIES: hypothetical protein [Paenibacillus]OKP73876.1 hypothetical protein A3842_21280 [Paenibacillus sp. P3E]OKP87313.1 hypothetical protein A3848_20360 [Paenibacillus sp. P32E]OKP87986.1 hypothetical protein A3844_09255 [Paenibacillus helianthi]
MVIYLLLIYAIIVVIDPYGLLKQGKKRDFYVCSALCLVSFSLAFALSMHWDIPSPSPTIIYMVKKLF